MEECAPFEEFIVVMGQFSHSFEYTLKMFVYPIKMRVEGVGKNQVFILTSISPHN